MKPPQQTELVGRPEIWGVCGGSGSGKTTLARQLLKELGDTADFLALDSYYRDLSHLTFAERCDVNFDHPDSLDLDLFVEHLDLLRAGTTIEVPRYDFSQHSRSAGTDTLVPKSIVIADGILLLADERIRDRLDVAIFLDVPAGIRLERRVARDVAERARVAAEVREVFEQVVQPMEQLFVLPMQAEATAVVSYPFDAAAAAEELLERYTPTAQ